MALSGREMERHNRLPRLLVRSSSGVGQATLLQAEVVRLAKNAAKKEKGKTVDEYDLNSVIFDPQSREWTVSFNSRSSSRSSEKCLLVIVRDDTRETKVLRC
jgi:hypothetical protein